MKVGFFLQRRFAYVGHEMARLLKERYGVSEFCGYVGMRSSYEFLKNQKDISYTSLVLEDDVYAQYRDEKTDLDFLRKLELKTVPPTLWRYICLDRVVRYGQLVREYPHDTAPYTHDEMLRIVQVTAKEVARFLDTERPDVLMFSVIGNISSLLLYNLAKERGVRTLIIDSARIGNKFFVSEEYDHSTYLEQTFKRIRASGSPRREEARELLARFQKESRYYLENSQAMGHFSQVRKPSVLKDLSLTRLWKIFFSFFALTREYMRFKNDYVTLNPLLAFTDKLRRKGRLLRGYADLYDRAEEGGQFVYFPLHSEPEAYPSLLAPAYTDQVWLIEQIARSIPAHMTLYVKDHPVMLGYRRRSFYKRIKKLPNVKLIDARSDSLSLIKKSKMVITILGTAGWEAVLLKKPVIIFGKVFYQHVPCAKRCESIEELPALVNDLLTTFTYDEEVLTDFIAALLEESVDVDIVHMWDVERGARIVERRDELIPLVDLIASKLHLQKIA